MGLWLLLFPSLLLGWAVLASADRSHDTGNHKTSSSGALLWSTAKEEVDLLRNPQAQEDSTKAVANDDSDGGFSSLEGMLQWAIGNFIHYFSSLLTYTHP
jgi:hsp70-interacting protein